MTTLKKLLLATALISAPTCALAAAPSSSASNAQSTTVGEVIVTAQKRSERAVDVPIAISTFNTDTLTNLGFTNVTDITQSVPSLSIQPYPNSSSTLSVTLRGVGQVDALQLARDPGVAIYLDDVYLAHGQGVTLDLGDIERVEVLRGPQGTLYGRNSVGGAMRFITGGPTGEFGGKEVLDVGDYGYVRSMTVVNTPDFDGLSAKLTYLRSSRGGWVDDPGTGRNYGEADQQGYRVALRWKPNDKLQADYVYDHSSQTGAGFLEQRVSHVAEFIFPFATPGPFPERLATAWRPSSIEERDNFTQSGHAFTVAWNLGPNLVLKSITAFRQIDTDQMHDTQEAFNLPAVQGQKAHDEQFSQEFLLTGSAYDGRIKYNVGAFYFDESGHQAFYSLGNPFALLVDPGNTYYAYRPPTEADLGPPTLGDITNTSKAIYGQLTWTPPVLDDRVSIDLGARYSKDYRALIKTDFFGTVAENSTYSSFDPSAAIRVRIADNINLYARYATAYRSGGFSIYTGSSPFGPENLSTYEVGLKALLFNRRLQLNLDAYRSKYTDIQLDFFSPSLTEIVTVNSGQATVKGVEGDFDLAVVAGLKVGGSFSYMETDSDVTNPFFHTHTIGVLPFAPTWKYDLHANYSFPPTPFGVVSAYVAYTYNGSELGSVGNPSPDDTRPSFHLVNARVTLSEIKLPHGDLSVALWGNNLTNKGYELWHAFGAAEFGPPRNYGVNVTYRF